MIRVTTGSRLHFGLLNLPSAEAARSPGLDRDFGGAGMMVELPGVCLTVRSASDWSSVGPLADRALAFARQFAETLAPGTMPPQHMIVESCSPEHIGLGTGTQLGLCVARALAQVLGQQTPVASELARRVGRGLRSAIGVHGFAAGGFLVDAGQRQAGTLAPLVARVNVPAAWRVVLILPPWPTGLHGVHEREAFATLAQLSISSERTDRLCRLVLLGMLPALAEADIQAFGEAVYELNYRVGESFASVQGGVYAEPRIAELVAFLRSREVQGAGQSSWGPAVFAMVPDPDQAAHLAETVRQRYGWGQREVLVTQPRNQGAWTEAFRKN